MRAKYGTKLIANLAQQLTLEFGVGYGKRSLEQYRRFYLSFKDMGIANACVRNLTWTHLRIIMREASPEGRLWYVKTASEQMWSTRTLERKENRERPINAELLVCTNKAKVIKRGESKMGLIADSEDVYQGGKKR